MRTDDVSRRCKVQLKDGDLSEGMSPVSGFTESIKLTRKLTSSEGSLRNPRLRKTKLSEPTKAARRKSADGR